MKPTTRSPLTWITSLALVFSLCCGIIITDNAHAASNGNGPDGGKNSEKHQKLAQDLREKARSSESVKVILQLNDSMSGQLNALLNSNGVKIKKRFAALNTLALELPSSVVESLNQFEEVEFVSADSEIRPFGGHVAHTSGADNVRTMATTGALDGRALASRSSTLVFILHM